MADRLPINEAGRVPCWQVDAKQWVELHPVDAREQLRMGLVSLAEGEATEAVAEAKQVVETPSEPGLPASAHLEEMTVKDLEIYVEKNGLGVDLDKYRLKEDKVKAIKAAIHGAEAAPPAEE
jgi:hypothetical protein